jgi:hypothetical protein
VNSACLPLPLYTAEVSDGSTIAIVERAPTPEEYRRLRASVGWNVMRYLDASVQPGSFIGLMAAKDAEGFYRRYGFDRRPDDRPGMFRIR